MSRPPDITSPQTITELSNFDNYEIYSLVVASSKDGINHHYKGGYLGHDTYISDTKAEISEAEYNAYIANYVPAIGGSEPNQAEYRRVSETFINGGGGYKYFIWTNFFSSPGFVWDGIYYGNNQPPYPPTTTTSGASGDINSIYAIQQYSPQGKVNQAVIENLINKYPLNISAGYKLTIIHGAVGNNPPTNETIKYLPLSNEFDWRKLWVNGKIIFSGIANEAKEITYSYWARNPLENHPLINFTADFRQEKIKLVAGRPFSITLHHPIAETLIIDVSVVNLPSNQTANTTGDKPLNLGEYLASSSAYGNRIKSQYSDIPPPPEPPAPPNLSEYSGRSWAKLMRTNSTYLNGGFPEFASGYQVLRDSYTTNRTIYPAGTDYKVLKAGNNIWQHGADDWNFPALAPELLPDLPAGQTFDQLLYEPQTDGSFGTIIMDSIRTTQIYDLVVGLAARITALENTLDASVYGFDPDQPDEKRGANLGWYIEKIAQVLGIRRQPNGKYLEESEASKYQRTRANNPTWTKGDYAQSTWGKFGMASKYIPTTYQDGQRQDNQYDIVHDFVQKLDAIVDMLDHSQGIQHSSNIRLPVGNQVQAYSNQGAAVQDMAARLIALERSIEQLQVMAIESGNSLRELFPGIGIPITTKSVHVEVGGQVREIFYPAYQQSKPSLRQVLGSLQEHAGMTLGALMPRSNPLAALNPWRKKK